MRQRSLHQLDIIEAAESAEKQAKFLTQSLKKQNEEQFPELAHLVKPEDYEKCEKGLALAMLDIAFSPQLFESS